MARLPRAGWEMADQVGHDDGQGRDEGGAEHQEGHFRAREGEKPGSEHQEGCFCAREGRKLIPEAEGRQGLQTRTPSSDGEPLP